MQLWWIHRQLDACFMAASDDLAGPIEGQGERGGEWWQPEGMWHDGCPEEGRGRQS